MDFAKKGILILVVVALSGCSTVAGAKLLMPEHFGLEKVNDQIYVEAGADAATRAQLVEAMAQARSEIQTAYGGVESSPVVNACITESCYSAFGGMGSKAKIYGNYILLSPRGLDWHFLTHEWSHDEIRARLGWLAWWHLPQWFDEGVAVAISQEPTQSEAHWDYLTDAGVARPTREQLLSYRSLQQWLDAVQQFGETRNQERKARGEVEIRPVYTAAGHEVRGWLGQVHYAGLLALIDRMNQGEDFDTIYRNPN